MTAALRLVRPDMDGSEPVLPPIERFELAMRARSLAVRTIEDRLTTLRVLAEFAGVPVEAVSALQIQRWLGREGLCASTRQTYHSAVRAFFLWWADEGGVDVTARLKAPRRPRSVPHPVTVEQLERVLAQRMHGRTRVMILLAALAGLRVHEIAQVRGTDLDLVERTLRVTGKGGHTASLPLHPLLVEAGTSMPRAGWWFPANAAGEGHALPRSVSRAIGGVMRRAGVPGSAHSLRHFFGTELVLAGADLRTAHSLLRHSSLQSTEIYTQVRDSRRVEAVDRLTVGGGS